MLKIPRQVQKNAKRGNRMKAQGYQGGKNQGISRGLQLETHDEITIRDAMVMRAWFARHVKTSYGNYREWTRASDEEREVLSGWKGAVAWLLWGGTAAYYWILSEKVQEQIHRWGTKTKRRLKQRVTVHKGLVE